MKKLKFKEVTSKKELEDYFRFRYEIYSDSDNKVFLHENENKIDIDYFDINARHYAISCGEDKAGYLRVVYPKTEFKNSEALEIGNYYKLLADEENIQKNGKAPFPFLSYEGVPDSHWQFYYDLKSRNEPLIEASRIMIHPDYRTIRTAKFLIECTIALYVHAFTNIKHTVMNCCVDHGFIYKHYGFKEIADNGKFSSKGLNKISLTMPVSLLSVPAKLHGNFREMAEEFKTTDKIEREL